MFEIGDGKKAIGITFLFIAIQISPLAVAVMNALFACVSAVLNIIPNKKLIDYGIKEQIKDVYSSITFVSYYVFIGLSYCEIRIC